MLRSQSARFVSGRIERMTHCLRFEWMEKFSFADHYSTFGLSATGSNKLGQLTSMLS